MEYILFNDTFLSVYFLYFTYPMQDKVLSLNSALKYGRGCLILKYQGTKLDHAKQ